MTRGFGFNTVVEVNGTQFQVQTEPCRRGDDAAMAIETTVFHGGRVHFSRRTSCASADEEGIREQVRSQHAAVMAELRRGELSAEP